MGTFHPENPSKFSLLIDFRYPIFLKCIFCFLDMPGALDVAYEAVMGNIGTLAGNSTLATPGLDFNNSNRTIRLEDGQLSATVLVPIINVSSPFSALKLL